MDSEDSFATQISKLPPPILTQTGIGGVQQDAGATYNPTDIYKQLENERKNQPAQQMQMQQQNFPETPVNGNYYAQPSQMPQPPPQYYAGPAQPTTIAPPPSISDTFERKKKKKRAAAWSIDVIKKKQPWILAAVMFLVIVYGLPRLRTISALINPVSGQLSTPAIAAACIASGLLASIASDSM